MRLKGIKMSQFWQSYYEIKSWNYEIKKSKLSLKYKIMTEIEIEIKKTKLLD